MEATADLLTGMQAIADFLKIGRRTAYHLSYFEGMPTFKLAGKVCARPTALNAWLAEREAAARKAETRH